MPPLALNDVSLDEADARRVLLVQCVETAAPGPLWTDEDRRWASRAASQSVADGGDARVRWIAQRASLASRRLAARDAALRRALEHPLWRPAWSAAAFGAGASIGLLSDALLAGPYFDLLSPPFYALLVWNLVLYLALASRVLRHGAAPGPLRLGVVGALSRWLRRIAASRAGSDFALRWMTVSQPLTAARAAWLLHLAGAALALGLVAGMYGRALVFDYRAGWATTLLDARLVHALLAAVFAPAQALSGIALPDATGVAALRLTPGLTATASAAPWLHLMAITLVLAVLLPRLVLATLARQRAARLERAFPLPLSGTYFDRLRPPAARSTAAALHVVPHGRELAPEAAARLGRWMRQALGPDIALTVAAPVPWGEEEAGTAIPPSAGRSVALLDLAATPEDEVHGRLLRALAGRPLLLLDEAEFAHRFGRGERLARRRAAWAALAAAQDVPLVTVNLDDPDPASATALRAAWEA